ncbi:MAG: LytR/AlgR family response regulator transcription factor [Bacillota bacterium]
MIKALLVDDNEAARLYLRTTLEQTGLVEVIDEADNVESALKKIVLYRPDAVFLDINMEEENSGVILAKEALSIMPTVRIVFVTAYRDFAVEAFEFNSVDYILKPFDEKRVRTAIMRIIQSKYPEAKQNDHIQGKILLKIGKEYKLVEYDNIYFIEKVGPKIKVHVKNQNKPFELYEKLNNLEKRLDNCGQLIRAHRSYIINLNHVIGFEPWGETSLQVLFQHYDKTALISRVKFEEIKIRLAG